MYALLITLTKQNVFRRLKKIKKTQLKKEKINII